MIDQTQYSLPGISNPIEPKKSNKRNFIAFDGTIEIPVYGPIDSNLPDPELKIYISLEFGREIELQFMDTAGLYVLKKIENGNVKGYYLEITDDDLLLSRGSYTLRIVKDGKQINELYIISQNNPARRDTLEYVWPTLSKGIAVDYCDNCN